VAARVFLHSGARLDFAQRAMTSLERTLIALEASEEAARANAVLSGKAKRAQLLKTRAELDAEAKAYVKRVEKDVGASKETIFTLGNIAINALHLISLLADWNSGKPGVRRMKLAYERLVASEKNTLDGTMLEAWNSRPYGCKGGLKGALLARYNMLKERGYVAGGNTESEIYKTGKAVKTFNSWVESSQLQKFFPGCGGFRKQQAASEKVRAIESRIGGPMDRDEMYKQFPCLQPGWPDQLGNRKLDFELELDARARRDAQEPLSPSLAQAAQADQAMAAARKNEKVTRQAEKAEREAGGYDGEQASAFATMFHSDDETDAGSDDEESDDESGSGSKSTRSVQPSSPALSMPSSMPSSRPVQPLSPSLGPREEGLDAGPRFSPERAAAKREREWEVESEDEFEKKRRLEVDGLDEQQDTDDDSGGEMDY
jgi:hypothetical protein